MQTNTSIKNIDDVEIGIEVKGTIAEWREVCEAISKGKKGYFGPAYTLLQRIQNSILTIERQIEQQDFDISKQ